MLAGVLMAAHDKDGNVLAGRMTGFEILDGLFVAFLECKMAMATKGNLS